MSRKTHTTLYSVLEKLTNERPVLQFNSYIRVTVKASDPAFELLRPMQYPRIHHRLQVQVIVRYKTDLALT